MIFEGAAWFFAWKEFSKLKGHWGYIEAVQRGKDPSIFVVLFEDSAAMLGLIVAFLGIWIGQVPGNLYLDGVASVVIGLILAGTAIWLAYETKSLLIGESANKEVIKTIRELARTHEEIQHVNEILTMHMGADFILVNLSVDFRDAVSAAAVEKTISELDDQIKAAVPEVRRVFVEAEARRHSSGSGEQ
jgi:divalent metal cation (Fe/Co/Zn/Cd) transporter